MQIRQFKKSSDCLPMSETQVNSKLTDLQLQPLRTVVCVYLATFKLEAKRSKPNTIWERKWGGEMRKRENFLTDSLFFLASEWDMSLMTSSLCNILLYYLHKRWERKITRNESVWFGLSVPESPWSCSGEDTWFFLDFHKQSQCHMCHFAIA